MIIDKMMRKNKFKTIGISVFVIVLMGSCASKKNSSMNNMVARMEVKEPIKGVCDNANVIAILPFPGNGQVKAQASKTKEEITAELNAKVSFLTDKPDYEDKGVVGLIVNCKGELVQYWMSNKSQSEALDAQIVAVFAELKKWTPGKVKNVSVDTTLLYGFTI